MKPEELADEIERLADGVTPGPWAVEPEAIVTRDPVEIGYERRMIADLRYFTIPHVDDNAALIVALRNNLPAILSALRRVGKLEAALRGVLSIWDEFGSLDSTDDDDQAAISCARQALTGEA
jgi:hypothetical protein